MNWIFIIAVGMTAVGAGLSLVGFIGKRVGDHPYCRKCGFDLFGKPDNSNVCSECGADLLANSALTIGTLQRRPGILWVGVPMLVPGIVLLSILGIGRFRGIRWIAYEPVFLLKYEAEGSNQEDCEDALRELTRRCRRGTLPNSEITSLVERGLAIQGQADHPWAGGWGNLIEDARAMGYVSDAQWRLYVRQSITMTPWLAIVVPNQIYQGEMVRCKDRALGARVGWNHTFTAYVRISAIWDGFEQKTEAVFHATGTPLDPRVDNWVDRNIDHKLFDGLADGPHSGWLCFEVTVFEEASAIDNAKIEAKIEAIMSKASTQSVQETVRQIETVNKASKLPPVGTIEIRLPMKFDMLPAKHSSTRAALRQ